MKRLKFRSFHAHEFANANKITQLIRRNSLGRDEVSSIRGIVRVSPLIYHIDKGKTAGGAAEESSFVETFVYTRLCMCIYVWRVFSVCNLSSFEGGKGNVCFLILTCHLRSWIMYAAYAPTLTDHLEYVVRIYRNDTTGYSSLPYFQTLCKRSWVIISQREISREFVLSREIFIDASFSWKSFSIRRSRSVVLIIHL